MKQENSFDLMEEVAKGLWNGIITWPEGTEGLDVEIDKAVSIQKILTENKKLELNKKEAEARLNMEKSQFKNQMAQEDKKLENDRSDRAEDISLKKDQAKVDLWKFIADCTLKGLPIIVSVGSIVMYRKLARQIMTFEFQEHGNIGSKTLQNVMSKVAPSLPK